MTAPAPTFVTVSGLLNTSFWVEMLHQYFKMFSMKNAHDS